MSTLAPALVEAVGARYQVDVRSAKPLLGGYDVWAESWRLESDDRGPLVLRADRSVSPQTAIWISDVTRSAAESGTPCCLPLRGVDGAVAFSTGGATVTVRPFVEGRGLDRDDPTQVRAAGATLGLLHGAAAGPPSDRPEPSPWDARFWSGDHDPPTLRDAQLDAWHEAFTHAVTAPSPTEWFTATSGLTTSCGPPGGWPLSSIGPKPEWTCSRGSWRGRRGSSDMTRHSGSSTSFADLGDVEYNTALQRAFLRLRHQPSAPLPDV